MRSTAQVGTHTGAGSAAPGAGSAAPPTARAPAQPARAPSGQPHRSKATSVREARRARSESRAPQRQLRFADVVTVRDLRSRSQVAPAQRGLLQADFPPLKATDRGPREVSAPRAVPLGERIPPAPQASWAPPAPAAPSSAGPGPNADVLATLGELVRQLSLRHSGKPD